MPGSGGCRRPATWPVGATTSPWWRRPTCPVGGPAPHGSAAYRFDTGPTVLTMPSLVERCFAAAGVDHGRPAHPATPSTRCTGPASPTAASCGSATGARRWPRRSARSAAPGEADGVPPLLRLADRALRAGDAELHRPQLRLAARPGPAAGARAAAAARRGRSGASTPRCGASSTDERLRRLFSFQSLYAGLAPLRGARGLRRDHLHGRRQRRVRARRWHARPARRLAAAAERAGVEFRYGDAVERIVLAERHGGPGPRGPPRRRRASSPPTRWCATADLPVAYRTLLPGHRRAAGRPAWPLLAVAPWCGTSARGASCPPGVAHHNIHFGARLGRRVPRRDATTAAACPIRRCSSPCRRSTSRRWRRPAAHVLYVLEPVPNLDGRIDWAAERARARDDLAAAVEPPRLPGRRRGRALRRPARLGGARAWSGAPRSPCRTASSRPGPFRPANLERRAPGPGVRRLGHRPRRRRADGARVRRAGRRATPWLDVTASGGERT